MRAVSSTYDLIEDADTKAIDHAVVICGGGPTGLMLAGELALAGADVAIVERRPNQDLAGSRAGGLHARSIELLDQRGIADRFLAAGEAMQVTGFALNRLDISDFPTRHNYGLALWQNHIERILAEWVAELGVPTYRARDVVGVGEKEASVDVGLAGQPLGVGPVVLAHALRLRLRHPARRLCLPLHRGGTGELGEHLVELGHGGCVFLLLQDSKFPACQGPRRAAAMCHRCRRPPRDGASSAAPPRVRSGPAPAPPSAR